MSRDSLSKELELSRQENSQVMLLASILLLVLTSVGLVAFGISRTRSLSAVRHSRDELARTTERLQESERRYRSAFDDAIVPKLLIDLESRAVVDANIPAGQLCRSEPSELRGTDVADLRPDWLVRAVSGFEPENDDESCRIEEWFDDSGASHHAEVWATPLSLEGKSCALVTVHDITEDRRVEEERLRVDRLDSLGILEGGIAHDFNNALGAVLGHVSLARRRVGNGSDAQPLLAAAEFAIDHATTLTSQLLAFAKGGEPQRELLDVRNVVFESVSFALSGSDVKVEYDFADDLWAAQVDRGQLRQVISNIVINADQAMEGGGRLIVRARNLDAKESLSLTAGPGPYVFVAITDFGPGIPKDIQDRIMDPYFSTKPDGSGLGLATAFAVLLRHRGWLDCTSAAGSGSTFSIYLSAQPDHVPTQVDEARIDLTGSESVLVMDDDPLVLEVYSKALTDLGYRVELVTDGLEAAKRYATQRESGRAFDLVIMDLTIPGGVGGKAAMEEVRQLDPQALGIVASGYCRDPVMSNYRDAGFAASLSKPFSVEDLGRVVRRVLNERDAQASR